MTTYHMDLVPLLRNVFEDDRADVMKQPELNCYMFKIRGRLYTIDNELYKAYSLCNLMDSLQDAVKTAETGKYYREEHIQALEGRVLPPAKSPLEKSYQEWQDAKGKAELSEMLFFTWLIIMVAWTLWSI